MPELSTRNDCSVKELADAHEKHKNDAAYYGGAPSGRASITGRVHFDAVPAELRARRQWVCWRIEQRPSGPAKVPLDPHTGRRASVTDSATWGAWDGALTYHREHPGTTSGIGYVLTADDPYVGIDLDHARDPETGALAAWAAEIVAELGSYAEASVSGTGVHVIVRGSWSDVVPAGRPRNRGPYGGGHVEVYEHSRYLVVTGHRIPDTPDGIAEAGPALARLYARVFPQTAPPVRPVAAPQSGADQSDEDLLARIRRSAQGDRFARLWDGDTSGYPSQSEADLALCGILARWTGGDPDRIGHLFQQSGLHRADKWGDRSDYRERTIARALEVRTEYYSPSANGPQRNGHPPRAAAACSDREPGDDATSEACAVATRLSDVTAEPVDWLWERFVARGTVNILDGDPDLGKSTVTLDLAARVTCGRPMPGETAPGDYGGRGVLILSAEDALAQTIRPRLDAAGADVARVWHLDAVKRGDDESPPVLPFDLDVIEQLVLEHKVVLLVVDPLMAYLDGQVNAHRDQDVRRALHRLKVLAERTGVAVLVVRHLNKLTGGPALYRGGGSIGIIGAARIGLLVGRHPEQRDRRVLAVNKNNLAPHRNRRSIAYDLVDAGSGVARVEWGEEVDLRPDDILGQHAGKQTAADQCAEAMRDLLADGARESQELTAELLHMGHSEATVKRCRRTLGVRARRVGFGGEGRWMVELPDTSPTP